MAAITFLRLPFAILVYGICSARSECYIKPFDIISQNLQYSANLSQIAPCPLTEVNISRLYLDGECLDDACTTPARPNNASCLQVFSPANDNNYTNLSLLPTQDAPQLIFADKTVCGIPVPSVSYVYVSTNCTYFNTSWILLDRDRDPIGCHVFKAYNYGAAIGVIVAVVLFLALLIGGWIFWYRRRSRQGVYEPHQDIHMQPFPEGVTGQTYSSSLPAQQTASTDRLHPGFPAAGTTPATVPQGAPVYPPWTGGGFQPTGASTPR